MKTYPDSLYKTHGESTDNVNLAQFVAYERIRTVLVYKFSSWFENRCKIRRLEVFVNDDGLFMEHVIKKDNLYGILTDGELHYFWMVFQV
jgi:hypothetical protein